MSGREGWDFVFLEGYAAMGLIVLSEHTQACLALLPYTYFQHHINKSTSTYFFSVNKFNSQAHLPNQFHLYMYYIYIKKQVYSIFCFIFYYYFQIYCYSNCIILIYIYFHFFYFIFYILELFIYVFYIYFFKFTCCIGSLHKFQVFSFSPPFLFTHFQILL